MSRVLQLVTRDEPGGVRVLTRMVEAGLSARGHDVTTLALRGEGGSVAKVIAAIRSGGYDAILSYQVAASLVGHAAGWIAGVRVRATHLTAIPSAMRPAWRWLDRLWGSIGLHTDVIANSTATLASVADYPLAYRHKLRLIRHGVAPLPEQLRRDWRHALGIAPLAPLLAASGRLVSQKNHAAAVAALALLPGTHLIIAGEGALCAPLMRQADDLGVAERLHLVGNLDAAQLAGLLSAGDVYVFPSTWESFGLAVVEASMLGLPVVASDLPVLREVLAPALARFHPPNDAAALAAGIGDTLAHYPSTAERAASASATQQAHAVGGMIDAYCRLLDGAI
ncbi:glycosyltransferase family 4 protein [Devosia sp. SL43]|uniref:glycosyltransferase family 4 protein n=1 Tax=Devosia sp. SL43 TaxID=2806348 RepID=UPI001F35D552|nr:glycosyltransferase family 4 protein [Devosia sp. SL43]UJW84815.1 glycosyltransferase family 4 protein [Devosia sp. SL43]